VVVDLQLPVQSVPITTNVVSSNPVHGKVYSIQHYMIKFVSDLQQVSGFLWVLQFILTKYFMSINILYYNFIISAYLVNKGENSGRTDA
jgi:hypothetical protein